MRPVPPLRQHHEGAEYAPCAVLASKSRDCQGALCRQAAPMEVRRDGRWELAPGVSIAPAALRWQATASSGPGGQHVNTTMSAVLVHLPLAALNGLNEAARARLRLLAGSRLNLADEIVLRHDAYREQGRNRAALEERIQALVRQALIVPKKRRPTRPGRGAIERRLQGKRENAQRKQRRGENPREME